MRKLIVHADDLGLSEKVNAGIAQAHRRGILRSASIMASGRAFDDAVALCRRLATLDIGVHLTVVEEQSILAPREIPSLVDQSSGAFYQHAKTFALRYFRGKVRRGEVRREWEAQITRVRDRGIEISHLDSHQHLHMLPGLLGITLELAKQYGIPAVRFPRERWARYMFARWDGIKRVAELAVLRSFCAVARSDGVVQADHFLGFFFGGRLNRQNLQTLLRHAPRGGVAELMCHPGLADPKSPYPHWHYQWTAELKALVDPAVRQWLQQRNVQLISYRELAAS